MDYVCKAGRVRDGTVWQTWARGGSFRRMMECWKQHSQDASKQAFSPQGKLLRSSCLPFAVCRVQFAS